MKTTTKMVFIALMVLLASACGSKSSSSDVQRDRQEGMVAEGVARVGMPAIHNFRELQLLKDLYELRDQEGYITYAYAYNEMQGKYVFFCNSIGYPIPYATQYSAPESMQHYYIRSPGHEDNHYGAERLPQPEPNGLFIPASAEGTWVMCKDPDPSSPKVGAAYSEPKLTVLPFKMSCRVVQDGIPGISCYHEEAAVPPEAPAR